MSTTLITILLVGFSCLTGLILAWSLTAAWEGMPGEWFCDYREIPGRRDSREDDATKRSRFLLRTAVFAWYLSALMWGLMTGSRVQATRPEEEIAFLILSAIVTVWVLGLILMSDKKYQIIPDQLVVLLCACGVVRTSALTWLATHSLRSVLGVLSVHAAAGFVCAGLFFLLGSGAGLLVKIKDGLLSKEDLAKCSDAFGMGDVKFLFAIGMLLGVEGGLWTLILASLACGLCAGVLLIAGRLKAGSPHPFGPYLCVAASVILLVQIMSL